MTPQDNTVERQRDKARNRYYQKYYGITLEDYTRLLERQSHKCACCGTQTDRLKQRLSVDHNHTTREIRGLLCFRCNHLLIGRVEDHNVFQRAADYLAGPYTGYFVPNEFIKGQKKKRRRRKKK